MKEQINTKLVEKAYETFNSGDVESFLNLFSNDVGWSTPEIENVLLEGKFSGRENLARFISDFTENYEEISQIEPKEFIVQGDKVVVLGHFAARSKLTNRQYETDFAHIFTVENGKITGFLEFFDNAAAGRAHSAATATQTA